MKSKLNLSFPKQAFKTKRANTPELNSSDKEAVEKMKQNRAKLGNLVEKCNAEQTGDDQLLKLCDYWLFLEDHF